MLNYIIQVILFQVLFLAVYDLFLSKETFFTKNRWYLLGTAITSFLIPFIKIPTFKNVVPQEINIILPEIVLSPQTVIEKTSWYQSINYIDVCIGLMSFLFLVLFLIKLSRIISLIFNNEIIKKPLYSLVLLPKQAKAFSFFNYIFLGKEISEVQKEKIIQHELVHSKQKHSIDLLFFEFLKIIMWFNPMIWLYQHRITLVHEYISDAVVTKNTEKQNYINNILSDLFQVESISFINQFYKHSLIKKRILMMTKQKSKQIKQLKYLLLIPVLTSMLFYTACSETQAQESVAVKKKQTMYIGKIKNSELSDIETYLDYYVSMDGSGIGKEITIDQLLPEEKFEFEALKTKYKEQRGENFDKVYNFKFYELNDRRIIGLHMDKNYKVTTKSSYDDSLTFNELDILPTFPGCSDGDKECFQKELMNHVIKNFDYKFANTLNLEKGTQRIYAKFKISKEGKIEDLKVRAPHVELVKETERVITSLPKLKPGQSKGKAVSVRYTLPISFKIK